jgi:murein DD-endopeptidase MepM/ murein hydrolase activator NlpD
MKFSTAIRAGAADPSIKIVVCRLAAIFLLLTPGAPVSFGAQPLFKYKDESGQWVFSDKQPTAGQHYEQANRASAALLTPRAQVRREDTGDTVVLVAENTCLCPVQIGLVFTLASNIVYAAGGTVSAGDVINVVVPASATVQLATMRRDDSDAPWSVDFKDAFLLGDPGAIHQPDSVYRPPFAAARQFTVSQAWPDAITHTTPDSRHAIDIAMPEQSGVYAARGGLVVSVAYSNFLGGTDRAEFGARANLVKIMHDDGTFGIYAHLSWDSIRVRPGQRVVSGEYIANSGNTGFSTGPHLHFAVVRNDDSKLVSVPVTFSGRPGEIMQPKTGSPLHNP